MRPRPAKKIMKFAEITDEFADRLLPTMGTFATLDQIVSRIEGKSMFRTISSKPEVNLPWFHRYFLLFAQVKFHNSPPKPAIHH